MDEVKLKFGAQRPPRLLVHNIEILTFENLCCLVSKLLSAGRSSLCWVIPPSSIPPMIGSFPQDSVAKLEISSFFTCQFLLKSYISLNCYLQLCTYRSIVLVCISMDVVCITTCITLWYCASQSEFHSMSHCASYFRSKDVFCTIPQSSASEYVTICINQHAHHKVSFTICHNLHHHAGITPWREREECPTTEELTSSALVVSTVMYLS